MPSAAACFRVTNRRHECRVMFHDTMLTTGAYLEGAPTTFYAVLKDDPWFEDLRNANEYFVWLVRHLCLTLCPQS